MVRILSFQVMAPLQPVHQIPVQELSRKVYSQLFSTKSHVLVFMVSVDPILFKLLSLIFPLISKHPRELAIIIFQLVAFPHLLWFWASNQLSQVQFLFLCLFVLFLQFPILPQVVLIFQSRQTSFEFIGLHQELAFLKFVDLELIWIQALSRTLIILLPKALQAIQVESLDLQVAFLKTLELSFEQLKSEDHQASEVFQFQVSSFKLIWKLLQVELAKVNLLTAIVVQVLQADE